MTKNEQKYSVTSRRQRLSKHKIESVKTISCDEQERKN